MNNILDFGIEFIARLQALGSWQTGLMTAISFLGTEEFYMLALPVIYWCFNSGLGMRVAVVLVISSGLNDALKMTLHGPRPYWISEKVTGFAEETSFGAPSGHSQSAASIWGIVAASSKKTWIWVAVVLLVFLIGISRLSLGVHFPHDVLLGWLFGALILWLTLRSWEPVGAWAKKQSLGRQILFAWLGSLALLIFPVGVFAWLRLSGWEAPAEWASFATQAVTLDGGMTSAGTLFGGLAGLAWITQRGGFNEKGTWKQLVLRYLLGVAGVLAIRYGLKFIFPEGDTLLAYSLRYLRYACIGFWLAGGAPWAFVRLKLAEKKG